MAKGEIMTSIEERLKKIKAIPPASNEDKIGQRMIAALLEQKTVPFLEKNKGCKEAQYSANDLRKILPGDPNRALKTVRQFVNDHIRLYNANHKNGSVFRMRTSDTDSDINILIGRFKSENNGNNGNNDNNDDIDKKITDEINGLNVEGVQDDGSDKSLGGVPVEDLSPEIRDEIKNRMTHAT